MIIYKLQQNKTNKVYVGYSVNDNPNNYGTGKYIKRAVNIGLVNLSLIILNMVLMKQYKNLFLKRKGLLKNYKFY